MGKSPVNQSKVRIFSNHAALMTRVATLQESKLESTKNCLIRPLPGERIAASSESGRYSEHDWCGVRKLDLELLHAP